MTPTARTPKTTTPSESATREAAAALAGFEREIDIGEHAVLPEALGDAPHLDQRHNESLRFKSAPALTQAPISILSWVTGRR